MRERAARAGATSAPAAHTAPHRQRATPPRGLPAPAWPRCYARRLAPAPAARAPRSATDADRPELSCSRQRRRPAGKCMSCPATAGLWSVGVYGFVLWLTTIVKAGSGYGIAAPGLPSAILYAFGVLGVFSGAYVVGWPHDPAGQRALATARLSSALP